MRKATVLAASAAFAFFGLSSVNSANAGPSFALQVGEPTFCFGFDEDVGQCLLYLGDKQSCESLTPCPTSPFAPGVPSFRAVGGEKPGVCYFVVPPRPAPMGSDASADGVIAEPMCRFYIVRDRPTQ